MDAPARGEQAEPASSLRSAFDGVYVVSLPWREDRRATLRALYGDTLLRGCTWLSGRALPRTLPRTLPLLTGAAAAIAATGAATGAAAAAVDPHAAWRTPLTPEERSWLGPSWTLGANAQAACALAHVHAWKRALADGCRLALFLEDDVRFGSVLDGDAGARAGSHASAAAAAETIQSVLGAIAAHRASPRSKKPRFEGAEAYFLGGATFKKHSPPPKPDVARSSASAAVSVTRSSPFAFYPLQAVCTTVAYVLNDVALRALVETVSKTGLGDPVDFALQTFIRARFGGDSAYVCLHPEFAWQAPECGSDILGIPSTL